MGFISVFLPKGEKKMKNTASLIKMNVQNEKILVLTAYDYPSAKLAEQAGVDVILVGDSLGMVVLGYDSTVKVTVDDMIHHVKAARRGAPDTFLVLDMPFGSFHGSLERTLNNAVRIFQETGAEAVKLEGADEVVEVGKLLTQTGIQLVTQLGQLPQTAGGLACYKVQRKTADDAQKLIDDAWACEAAGACMLVLKCTP